MNWLPGKTKSGEFDQYYQVSDCGRYTICKVGGPRGITYEPWFGKQNLAVGYPSAEAARAHVDAHAASEVKAA